MLYPELFYDLCCALSCSMIDVVAWVVLWFMMYPELFYDLCCTLSCSMIYVVPWLVLWFMLYPELFYDLCCALSCSMIYVVHVQSWHQQWLTSLPCMLPTYFTWGLSPSVSSDLPIFKTHSLCPVKKKLKLFYVSVYKHVIKDCYLWQFETFVCSITSLQWKCNLFIKLWQSIRCCHEHLGFNQQFTSSWKFLFFRLF